jgi:hypothetical protein
MKCCFDTNVLDWILQDARGAQLMDLVEGRQLQAIVAADNAYEVHRIPDVNGGWEVRNPDVRSID